VSDDAARGRPDDDRATSAARRRARRTSNRSLDIPSTPPPQAQPFPQDAPVSSHDDLPPSAPDKSIATRPGAVALPAGLPQDAAGEHDTSGSHPADRSFEIMNRAFNLEDLALEPITAEARQQPDARPAAESSSGARYPPRSDVAPARSAFDRLYPPPHMTGGRSLENLAVGGGGGRVDARLNRSFEPSSYLPDRRPVTLSGANNARQASAPDVRQPGRTGTVQFNTAADAIDV